jgi:hypothetical protein
MVACSIFFGASYLLARRNSRIHGLWNGRVWPRTAEIPEAGGFRMEETEVVLPGIWYRLEPWSPRNTALSPKAWPQLFWLRRNVAIMSKGLRTNTRKRALSISMSPELHSLCSCSSSRLVVEMLPRQLPEGREARRLNII